VIASRLAGQHDALGSAAGERPDGVLAAAEVRARDPDELVLEDEGAGEGGRVEGVLEEEAPVGLASYLLDVAAGVVDVGVGLSVTPV
jgi:hypothetical protein